MQNLSHCRPFGSRGSTSCPFRVMYPGNNVLSCACVFQMWEITFPEFFTCTQRNTLYICVRETKSLQSRGSIALDSTGLPPALAGIRDCTTPSPCAIVSSTEVFFLFSRVALICIVLHCQLSDFGHGSLSIYLSLSPSTAHRPSESGHVSIAGGIPRQYRRKFFEKTGSRSITPGIPGRDLPRSPHVHPPRWNKPAVVKSALTINRFGRIIRVAQNRNSRDHTHLRRSPSFPKRSFSDWLTFSKMFSKE